MEKIINQLTTLKDIGPRPGFLNVTKRAILAERQETVFSFDVFFRPLYIGGFAALLLVLTFSYTILSIGKPAYASLDARNLQNELQDLTISITLDEIAYSQTAAHAVASALQEITDDKFRHLNSRVLEGERGAFELPEADQRIEDLLNTAIF